MTVGDPAGIGPEIARKAAADEALSSRARSFFTGRPRTRGRAFRARPCVRGSRARGVRRDRLAQQPMRWRRRIDAIATAPINKEAFAAAGLPWRGHTELLAHLTGAPRVAMMFYAESLRVVLATVHIALAEVPRALTREVVEGTIELLRASCRASASRRRGWRSPA